METMAQMKKTKHVEAFYADDGDTQADSRHQINQAWEIIAPLWPLQNLIARNPLMGLEALSFREALKTAAIHFESQEIPEHLENINRETIKWCQAFFDGGQATILMPFREEGFYQAFRKLAVFDNRLKSEQKWLKQLPDDPEDAIWLCLKELAVSPDAKNVFLTQLLSSLPGWSGYVKYLSDWSASDETVYVRGKFDYLAVRIILTRLLWPNAGSEWVISAPEKNLSDVLLDIEMKEARYRLPLLKRLKQSALHIRQKKEKEIPDAQFIFCIDVRSEPFRRAIEFQGHYETFGFAGFFGLPVQISQPEKGVSSAACPVLLKPKHRVIKETACCSEKHVVRKMVDEMVGTLKRGYDALKYNFTTPFALVEAAGPFLGLKMLLKTWDPILWGALGAKKEADEARFLLSEAYHPDSGIDLVDQCQYAENALRMMGLTSHFAPLVFVCGHGSQSENNPFQSALDCGACGARPGGDNARIFAETLNHPRVRSFLATRGIVIPEDTCFLAAEHNTTTDELKIFPETTIKPSQQLLFTKVEKALKAAQVDNNRSRAPSLNILSRSMEVVSQSILKRSLDWAQTRPEWGLARNAAFIVGPRALTSDINLEGRAFLHSYDWEKDPEGVFLETILTAPMVVAQWINGQYLFSTLDNVAYGGGNKVTQNITGKAGIMQGNGSDLMHGLSWQSVFQENNSPYHEPIRLMTVVYAPCRVIYQIVKKSEVLSRLLGNEWVTLMAVEPIDKRVYRLNKSLVWELIA